MEGEERFEGSWKHLRVWLFDWTEIEIGIGEQLGLEEQLDLEEQLGLEEQL